MIVIDQLRADEWEKALQLVLARVPGDERAERVRQCRSFVESGVLDPRGVWVARLDGGMSEVQACVLQEGASALFWLPTAGNDRATLLVETALRWCRSRGCKLAQAVAHVADRPWTTPLLHAGFKPITSMLHLSHDLVDIPSFVTPLRFEQYGPANAPIFEATLAQTYVGSADCPELEGLRTTREIIAGHKGQGRFHPNLWWLVLEGAKAIGVALVVELLDGSGFELAYLGLIPTFRGKGHGRAVLAHVLASVRQLPTTRLSLVVDERNLSALRLYQSLGFTFVDKQEVLL